jgi:Flp pilus assembly protein TadD
MSILLEALRQKSRGHSDAKKETASALTPNMVSNDFVGQQADKPHDAVLSLESLLEPLKIQPPEHLSWQLSAANRQPEMVSDVAQPEPEVLEDDRALELLFPIADESFAMVQSPIETVTEDLASAQVPSWSLVSSTPESKSLLDVVTVEDSEQSMSDSLFLTDRLQDNHEDVLVVGQDKDLPIGTLDVVDSQAQPVQGSSHHFDFEPNTMAQDSIVRSVIEKSNPTVETAASATPVFSAAKTNTPASASNYLNLLNNKHNGPEQPTLSKKIRLQKPSISPKILVAGVLAATVVGIGYYGFHLWEQDQVQLAEQMARYEAPIVMPAVNNEPSAPLYDEHDASARLTDATGLPVPVVDTPEQTKVTDVTRTATALVPDVKKRRQSVDAALLQKPPVGVVIKGVAISDLINTAWNSWRQGDIVAAERNYRQVLERQPNNRDALMGMFAITQLQTSTAAQSQDIADRLMELYPRDEEVKALVAHVVYSNSASVGNNESDLKNQLQNTPSNAALYYQLGILYANTKRWSEAQSVFFKAVSLDAAQPEYLANLAISYDQLGKTDLAIAGYRKALEAARSRPSLLNQDALAARLQFLSSSLSQGE